METIKFIEERRNQPHNSGWHETEVDHIDIYAIIKGQKRHIRGRVIKIMSDLKFNAVERDKEEIETLKKEFIKSKGDYICFYCHSGDKNPFDFIKYIKKNNYDFNDMFGIRYINSMKLWEFHGNLKQVSCAFSFRIYNKETIDEIKKQCKGIAIVKR